MLAAIAFLVGYAISVVAAMISIKKKNIAWNGLTVAYGTAINVAYCLSKNKPFDYLAALLFVGCLLVLGWLTARYEARS